MSTTTSPQITSVPSPSTTSNEGVQPGPPIITTSIIFASILLVLLLVFSGCLLRTWRNRNEAEFTVRAAEELARRWGVGTVSVPRPILWDIHVRQESNNEGAVGGNGSESVWRGMKPLFVQTPKVPEKSLGIRHNTNQAPRRRSLSRLFTRHRRTTPIPPIELVNTFRPSTPPLTIQGDLDVAVVIAMPSKIAAPHRSPQTAIDEVQLGVEAQNSKPEPLYYELGVTHVSLKDEVDAVDS